MLAWAAEAFSFFRLFKAGSDPVAPHNNNTNTTNNNDNDNDDNDNN